MKTNNKLYQKFCDVTQIDPYYEGFQLSEYSDIHYLAQQPKSGRLTAALYVFLEQLLSEETSINTVDRGLMDYLIAGIDRTLSGILDQILHHPEFQKLESIWKSLAYLIEQTDFDANIKVEIMDVSKEALLDDFEQASEISQTGLYQQIYEREYDVPGGEPFAAIISNDSFSAASKDVGLLQHISKVAALTHCPFVAAASPQFFNKKDFESVLNIQELDAYFDRSEYVLWNTFRQSEEARYIGLTLPRFLLRLPYKDEKSNPIFNYQEHVYESHEHYLWGAASFALAANLTKSFKQYGWALQIRGLESGGKVDGLPLHQYDLGHGFLTKIPTEIMVPETKELQFSKLGFIPLSYYKNSNFGCFFSANSIQEAPKYNTIEANRNAQINVRLPYVFLSSRIAHYLKVLQRENIGSNISREHLEASLNQWLKMLVTQMPHPDLEHISQHPLRSAYVRVIENEENPGFYRVLLHMVPHFQIEGVDVSLSVVSQLPNEGSRTN